MQRDVSTVFYRGQEIFDGLFAESLHIDQCLAMHIQMVYRCHIADEPLTTKSLDLFFPETVDIHAVFACKCLESALQLRRTSRPIRTKIRDLSRLLLQRSLAGGTLFGHSDALFISISRFGDDAHDLGDDLARPHEKYRIPFVCVFCGELGVVVQSGTGHCDAPYEHGIQDRDGCDDPAASDGVYDMLYACTRQLGGKFECDGIARMVCRQSQMFPEIQIVHFYHQPVDVKSESGTLGGDGTESLDECFEIFRTLEKNARGFKSEPFKCCDILRICRDGNTGF